MQTSSTNQSQSKNTVTSSDDSPAISCFALLGNPNTGKTTLFNRLCGIRAKTANFPGSTVEAHVGIFQRDGKSFKLVDLPGIYGLNLDLPESRTCKQYLAKEIHLEQSPEAVLVIADATNLRRNLIFIVQAIQQNLPAVVVLNMSDLARKQGVNIDRETLAECLGCPVMEVSARTGQGIDELYQIMFQPKMSLADLPDSTDAQVAAQWAEDVYARCVQSTSSQVLGHSPRTDWWDRILTHPITGLLTFLIIMAGVFFMIFSLASYPMTWIELLFEHLGIWTSVALPEGALRNLVTEGVIGGIAGTVVFLPQICLLFFLISLLEDTGYLSRAAFVMDRYLRRFGLPGQAFLPLLSAHACAIPAIMSAKLIPDHKDRVATVLVAPFMSCSARLPVYVLLVGILFRDNPLAQGLAFSGCYLLGAGAALFTALLFRRSVLKGTSRPMILELPAYRLPSLRTAFLIMFDRGWVFLKKAGTIIMAICIILWWMSAYPVLDNAAQVQALQTASALTSESDAALSSLLESDAVLLAASTGEDAEIALSEDALRILSKQGMAHSFAGRIGHVIEPVLSPIGCDWQLSIGVISSFAAREVFVSTLAVLFSGQDDVDEQGILSKITQAKRDDGSPLLTTSAAASLLVFFVLAMQCLPTLPVTRRETGHWGWALLQLGYMSTIAYVAALITYQSLLLFGGQ